MNVCIRQTVHSYYLERSILTYYALLNAKIEIRNRNILRIDSFNQIKIIDVFYHSINIRKQ